jgi:hypothetical protein
VCPGGWETLRTVAQLPTIVSLPFGWERKLPVNRDTPLRHHVASYRSFQTELLCLCTLLAQTEPGLHYVQPFVGIANTALGVNERICSAKTVRNSTGKTGLVSVLAFHPRSGNIELHPLLLY